MATIDTLVGQLGGHKGFAPANRFEVEISNIISRADADLLNYTCESVTLPGRNHASGEYTNNHVTKTFFYSHIDDDITLSFRLTNSLRLYELMYNWMQEHVDTSSYKLGWKSEYSKEIRLYTMDQTNSATGKWTLNKSYIKTLSPVEMSNSSENTIATFTVTIGFDTFDFNSIRVDTRGMGSAFI